MLKVTPLRPRAVAGRAAHTPEKTRLYRNGQNGQRRGHWAYTGNGQVEIGRRSVSVEFEKSYYPEEHDGKVLSIDAVPAFELQGGDYEIPDKITGTWIKTNPDKHREQATAKNKALDGCWVPLVKMVRGWNRANGRPVKPSFLLEVMAQELVEPPFSTYADEVRNFFARKKSRTQFESSPHAKCTFHMGQQSTIQKPKRLDSRWNMCRLVIRFGNGYGCFTACTITTAESRVC